MKCVNASELYNRVELDYILEQEEQQMSVEQLADKCYAPFGYTNAYINNNHFYITVYGD